MREFQSTRPVRGATRAPRPSTRPGTCFNPRAPCGARRGTRSHRSGSDTGFNPRAPCGARPASAFSPSTWLLFQSTRPVRGATGVVDDRRREREVSIHAPRAGRDGAVLVDNDGLLVSIHAPRAGRDSGYGTTLAPMSLFQSTRPVRGATRGLQDQYRRAQVSIHAPRAGRDVEGTDQAYIDQSFNPRAPCGARRAPRPSTRPGISFNPRAPCGARRETRSHRSGSDTGFNPRAPCGARREATFWPLLSSLFQSTRPVRGATRRRRLVGAPPVVSIHAPRAGRDSRLS